MTSRFGALATLLILCLSCSPTAAIADWRYASWGMTVADVEAAAAGRARRATPEDQRGERSRGNVVRLVAPVLWEGLSFKAQFAFDPDAEKLSSITLRLESTDAGAKKRLRRVLQAAYGKPFASQSGSGYEITVWKDGISQIGLTELEGASLAADAPAVSVNYQPLAVAATR